MWRRILGSFLSALMGWIVLVIYIGSTVKMNPNMSPDMVGEFSAGFGMIDYLASILMFGAWLVIILPLYLLVPLRSPLWRWPICTICGAIGGAAFLIVIGRLLLSSTEPWNDYIRPCIVAAGVGWITCLFASLTRGYFNTPKTGINKVK
jgi:hypothetical protein